MVWKVVSFATSALILVLLAPTAQSCPLALEGVPSHVQTADGESLALPDSIREAFQEAGVKSRPAVSLRELTRKGDRFVGIVSIATTNAEDRRSFTSTFIVSWSILNPLRSRLPRVKAKTELVWDYDVPKNFAGASGSTATCNYPAMTIDGPVIRIRIDTNLLPKSHPEYSQVGFADYFVRFLELSTGVLVPQPR